MKKITGRNKKLLAGACALCMALPTTAYAGISMMDTVATKATETKAETTGPILVGDLDDNGKIELADAQIALKIALKIQAPTGNQNVTGDADGNGKVELADAQKILKWALKIEVAPTPKPVESEMPDNSEEPAVSETPEESKTPVKSRKPAPTPIPAPSRTPVPTAPTLPAVEPADYVVTADAVTLVATNGAVEKDGIYTYTEANQKGIQFEWPYVGRTDLVESLADAGITSEVIVGVDRKKWEFNSSVWGAAGRDPESGLFDFSYEFPRPKWHTGVSISFWSKQKWQEEEKSNHTPLLVINRTDYCDVHKGDGMLGGTVNSHGSPGDCDYALVVRADGSVAYEAGDDAKNGFRADNYIADKDDTWTFYTVTIANDFITVYVNGQEMVYQSIDLNKDVFSECFNAGFMTKYNPVGPISNEMLDKDVRKYLTSKGSSLKYVGAYYLPAGKEDVPENYETNKEATLIGNGCYKPDKNLDEHKSLLMDLLTEKGTQLWLGGTTTCCVNSAGIGYGAYSTPVGSQVAGVQCYSQELTAPEVAAVYKDSVAKFKDVLGLE